VFPVALSRDGGERTLYVPTSSTGSSLFNPDNDLIRAFTTSEYLLPITTRSVETKASGKFFDSIDVSRIDLLKLDVQGCELEILEGLADETLAGCSLVELEATMHDYGPGYPTFCDIHALMTGRGFALLGPVGRPATAIPARQQVDTDERTECL
jgi:FkbM family methyltransferase